MVKITKRIVEAGGFRSRPRSCAEVVTRRRAKRSAVWRLRCCISLIIQSQPAGASVRVADRVRQALLAPSRRRFLAMSARLRAAGDALCLLVQAAIGRRNEKQNAGLGGASPSLSATLKWLRESPVI